MKNKIPASLLMVLSLMSLNAQVKLDSLLAYYPMNGNAGDSSGSAAHAAAFNIGDTTDRFGDLDHAFYFNGSAGYVSLPNDPALKPGFPFSISLWIYVDSFPTVHQRVYSSDDQTQSYAGFSLALSPQGGINVSYGNGIGTGSQFRRSLIPSNPIPKNKWVHVAATFKGLNAIDLYYDGVQQQGSYSGSATTIGYTSVHGVIGRFTTVNHGIRYIDALIDDVRIYNDTLDQNDVNFLQYDVPCTGVVYDSIPVFDTVQYNLTAYDSIPFYDTVLVSIQLTQYDTVAIANTLLINSSIGINENLEAIFKVYPNPSQDFIYVDLGDEKLNLEGKRIVIYDALGRKVFEVPIAQQKTKIETNSLEGNGTYFIQLINSEGQELLTRKIIVY
jgi:hypothetical protein